MTDATLPDPHAMSHAAVLDELALYLRPPGQGVHSISSGREALVAKTRAYLGEHWSPDDPWRDHLARGLGERDEPPTAALLALPSDTGAGMVRGANRGPEAIREHLGGAPAFDLGDVFVVPHLLEDAMHSTRQRNATQDAIYPEVPEPRRRALPFSPLSMCARVYRLLGAIAPRTRILLIGGDHTVTTPAMDVLLGGGPERNRDVGIVHFDAHTDLLPARLGVRHCFATWAYHANELLGRGERLIQIGIRTSAHDRAHWERGLGVRQIWAREANELGPEALARTVVDHLRDRGVRRVYVSNDIDGTDAYWASACGTPEVDGLQPEAVHAVLDAIADTDLDVIGADIVEVAPGLSLDRAAAARTVETATAYLRAELSLLQRDERKSRNPPGARE